MTTGIHAPLRGLILAGGQSRRMGREKSLIAYHGLPQHEWMARLMEPLCEEVWLSVADATRIETSRPLVIDRHPGEGPVGAILSALDHDPASAWLVVACDLPFLDEPTLRRLVAARLADTGAVAYRSARDGKIEPLCAIYEPAIAATWREGFHSGERCARKLLARCNVKRIDLPAGNPLENINTPDEHREALETLGRLQP